MGAGCYYTHKDGTKAFWITFEYEDEMDLEFFFEFEMANIETVIEELGYLKKDDRTFVNGLFTLTIESLYYGDGIVFYLEPNEDHYNLAVHNHTACYDKLKKALIEEGFKLRIATSGYTSTVLN